LASILLGLYLKKKQSILFSWPAV